jgi:demethylspheroidene O-methyltransferase
MIEDAIPPPAVPWWRGLYDRLLTNARFRHWAASFPLTRPVARRRTRALFDLCAGFVYSQILYACVRLDLFQILAQGPLSTATLAHRLGLSAESTETLLAGAVSLGLVDRRGPTHFGLGPLGVAMIDNPGVVAMVKHHALLYRDLADPVGLLRTETPGGALASYWAYAGADQPSALSAAHVADYSALMAASQAMIAAELLDAYKFGRHLSVMDVGGGEGAFLSALAARVGADPQLILFDLPSVAERAQARFAAAGLRQRATAIGGDFFTDELPYGAEVATLIRVLHDHDDAAALMLLKNIRRSLPPHGRLLVAEPMSGTKGALPIGDAYFGFYLMAMGSGRPRTRAEITAMLNQAGFTRTRLIGTNTPLLVRVIEAKP